jgi:hypothetical protein
MARRAALSFPLRSVQLALVVLSVALASCGSKDWSCTWSCNSTGQSGSHTYPNGPDPTTQCEADFGVGCNDFTCNCTQ